MLELMNVIRKQSDELHELLNTPYGTKVLSRLETAKSNKGAGDNVGEFPCPTSDNAGVVSVRDALYLHDVRV